MSTTFNALDIAQFLETESDIQLFLKEVAETGTVQDFISALGTAARAKGMTEIAKQAQVSRESLYRSLSENGKPQYQTIVKVVETLGCKLSVVPLSEVAPTKTA